MNARTHSCTHTKHIYTRLLPHRGTQKLKTVKKQDIAAKPDLTTKNRFLGEVKIAVAFLCKFFSYYSTFNNANFYLVMYELALQKNNI